MSKKKIVVGHYCEYFIYNEGAKTGLGSDDSPGYTIRMAWTNVNLSDSIREAWRTLKGVGGPAGDLVDEHEAALLRAEKCWSWGHKRIAIWKVKVCKSCVSMIPAHHSKCRCDYTNPRDFIDRLYFYDMERHGIIGEMPDGVT